MNRIVLSAALIALTFSTLFVIKKINKKGINEVPNILVVGTSSDFLHSHLLMKIIKLQDLILMLLKKPLNVLD